MPCFLAVAATSFARSASRRIWTICSSVNLLFFIGLSARDGESQHFTHAWSSFWQAGQIDMWSWPSSGDGARVWAINPRAWANDTNAIGPTVYQPFLFTGQYQDVESVA